MDGRPSFRLWVIFLMVALQKGSLCAKLIAGQSTLGTNFVVAFPATGHLGTINTTDLMFTSYNQNAWVRVTGVGFDEGFVAQTNSTYIMTFDPSWYVSHSTGIESKALHVHSDVPISVSYARTEPPSGLTPDATMVYPEPNGTDDNEYEFLLSGSHFNVNYNQGANFIIAAYEDDTSVNILLSDNQSWNIVLHQYQVYTRWLGNNGHSGKITSTKPISVFSGHYSARIEHSLDTSFASQYLHESMPPMESLGQEYVTIPIVFGDQRTGYVVRVVASTDSTAIRIPELDILVTRDEGDHYDFDTIGAVDSSRSIVITCLPACLVTQYTKETRHDGHMKMITVALTPVTSYTDQLLFTPPNRLAITGYSGILALTVATSQVGDIFLDGQNIKDSGWTVTDGGEHSYLAVDIAAGTHFLYTSDTSTHFAAYNYAVYSSTRGFGLNLGYGSYDVMSRDKQLVKMSTGYINH